MSLDLLPRTEENSLLKISLLILYDSTDNKNLPPSPKYLRLLIYILLSNHLSLSVSWAWRFTPNKYIMAQYVTFKIVTINNVVSVLGSLSFSLSQLLSVSCPWNNPHDKELKGASHPEPLRN